MGDGILRVFRPSGLHARVERAKRTWDELTRAEKIAIGGLGGLGAVVGVEMMRRSMRGGDETHKLVDRYQHAWDGEKREIEKTCMSRVHDLREMMLDAGREKPAREILITVKAGLEAQKAMTSSQIAMLGFIQEALDFNGNSFGMDSAWEEVPLTNGEALTKNATTQRWESQKIPGETNLRDVVGTFPEWEYHWTYGHIATWDVRNVKDLSGAFSNLSVAEPLDLRFWDTRNVLSMRRTFSEFGGLVDVGTWDTRSVTDMSRMFSGASRFKADLGMWKTGLVKDMSGMFSGALNFNCDIGKWDTSKVTTMRSMFKDAELLNSALSEWDVRNVKTMRSMFQNAKSLESPDLGRWKTGSVVDMSHMFSGASKFNGNIENWDTSEVTDMSNMFAGAVKFNRPLRWNTSNARSMRAMFFFASSFDQDIGGWNTSSVADMSHMFKNALAFNRKLNWDTGSVERRNEMFSEAPRMEEGNKPGFSIASGFGREARQGSRAYL